MDGGSRQFSTVGVRSAFKVVHYYRTVVVVEHGTACVQAPFMQVRQDAALWAACGLRCARNVDSHALVPVTFMGFVLDVDALVIGARLSTRMFTSSPQRSASCVSGV